MIIKEKEGEGNKIAKGIPSPSITFYQHIHLSPKINSAISFKREKS
jgi:hypothetical protein